MTQDKETLRILGKELRHLSPDLVSQCRAYLQAAGYNDFADAFEAKQGAARVPVPPLLLGMVAAILRISPDREDLPASRSASRWCLFHLGWT